MKNTLKDQANKRFMPSKIVGAVLTFASLVPLVIWVRDAWARTEGAVGSGELIWVTAALAGIGSGLWAGLGSKLYEMVLARLGKGGP